MSNSQENDNKTRKSEVHDKLRARAFVLVDDSGNERARLATTQDNSAKLSMFDTERRLRLSVEVAEDGAAAISIFSRKEPYQGEPDEEVTIKRMVLGCEGSNASYIEMAGKNYHTPELKMFDGKGERRVKLGVYPVNDSFLFLEGDKDSLSLQSRVGILTYRNQKQYHWPPASERFGERAPASMSAEEGQVLGQQAALNSEPSKHRVKASSIGAWADALTEIATGLQMPEEVAVRLTTIVGQMCDADEMKSTGSLIAQLIEDETLPTAFREAVADAAEEIMNKLNRGEEMTLAWIKVYFDKAMQREASQE